MIQAITESAFNAYLSTEDNRINTSVASTQIRHLFKFINDMDGSVEYYYAATETIYNRYTKFEFNYNVTEDLYAGATKMLPAGHWKYEVYEVSWAGTVKVAFGFAPSTETEILPVGIENKYSLNFDGVDDYVDFGDAAPFTPNYDSSGDGFSTSFWIKLSSGATANQQILAKSDFFASGAYHYEYNIRTTGTSKVKIIFYGGDSNSIIQSLQIDTTLSADTWHHVAFTFNLADANTSIIGYLDGVKKTNASGATYASAGTWAAVSNTVAPLYIGRIGNSYGKMKLDEISLWNYLLTQSDITSIYNEGNPTDLSLDRYIPEVVGYWRNGDTAGQSVYPTITDDSVDSNNGTMTNMAAEDIVTDAPSVAKGVVQGIVTKGIMYLDEKSGTEQVQYNQHTEPEATNYIWYGQDDSFKPTDLPGGTLDIIASFERNTNIESDENAAGVTLDPVHSTAAGTMEDGDKISKWSHSQWTGEDYSPVLVQTTSAEKPYWDVSMPGGSPRFLNGNFFDGLTTANAGGYTIYIRVNFDNLSQSPLIGKASEAPGFEQNNFKLRNASEFALNTDDSGRYFVESSNTIKTGIWYTIALQRTATNNANVYVNGGEYSDKSWGDTATGETGTFVSSMLGSDEGALQTMRGFISDFFYYADGSHTAADRAKMYNYLG